MFLAVASQLEISYFSAIARLALSEASLSYDSHLITLADHSNSNPEYIKLNPKGTVPTLVIESSNGKQKVFTESRDILNYAVSIHASLDGGHEARAFVERFYKGDLAYDVATGIAAPEQKRKDLVEKWAERVDNAEERMRKAGSEEERKKYEEKRAVVGFHGFRLDVLGFGNGDRSRNPQNAAKVAQFPTLGPPWGEEKADWMLGELETYLLKDGKDPSKDFLCSKEFRWVFGSRRGSLASQIAV